MRPFEGKKTPFGGIPGGLKDQNSISLFHCPLGAKEEKSMLRKLFLSGAFAFLAIFGAPALMAQGATVEVLDMYDPIDLVGSPYNIYDSMTPLDEITDAGGGGDVTWNPRGFYVIEDWHPTQDHRVLGGGSWDNYTYRDMPNCGVGISNSFTSSFEGSISVADFGVKIGYQSTVTLTWTTGVTVGPRRHGELLLYGVMWECRFAYERILGTEYGSARQGKSIHAVYADRPL